MNNQEISNLLTQYHNATSQELMQVIYEMLMKAEQQLHLSQDSSDKANGYYKRQIGSANGKLELKVPRDRNGDFRSQILPEPYIRNLGEKEVILRELVANSYSPNRIKATLRGIGFSCSDEDLEQIREQYLSSYQAWSTRQLKPEALGIFIDAYVCDLKDEESGKVKKACIYSVLSIDFEGKKELIGFYISFGNETKEYWLTVFNDLIVRGLKRPLLVVSDNFSGIIEAVKAVFELSLHQLCFVHLYRNITRNMGKGDAYEFNKSLKSIQSSKTYDDAISKFETLLEVYRSKYPSYIDFLNKNKEYYFQFLKLPEELRNFFYTTNAVESFNSSLEKLRIASGGFFQSIDSLKINVSILIDKLLPKWSKGVPKIKPHLYEARQLFVQVFGRQPT